MKDRYVVEYGAGTSAHYVADYGYDQQDKEYKKYLCSCQSSSVANRICSLLNKDHEQAIDLGK